MAWVPVQQQQLLSSPQQQYSQQHAQHAQQHQPTMSSQFHLFPLIETIGDALERGVRDHHVEELVNDLLSRFEACQQILNSPSNVSNLKTLTIQMQKQKLEEYENQLNLRSEALTKYKAMVEKAMGSI